MDDIYQKPIWWLWDYNNELMRFQFALQRRNEYSPEKYKVEMKNLTKYMEGKLRIVVERDTPKEDVGVFWKKKKRLDVLVKEFNAEYMKEKIDEGLLKKLFNEICKIVFSTEAPFSKHTPFPEISP